MIRDRSPSILRLSLAVIVTTAIVLGAIGGGALLFAYAGFYNVAATQEHTAIVYSVLQMTKKASVERRARDIRSPDLSDRSMINRGLAAYHEHCVTCHGGPGIPPADFAKGLTPGAPPLVQVAREWTPEQMYWATRQGIKMSGMPAWEFRLEDAEIWDIVAFLRMLPTISPLDYCAAIGTRSCGQSDAAHE